MRCPECGYTTFDNSQKCSKCGHDLVRVTSEAEKADNNPFDIISEIIEEYTHDLNDNNTLEIKDTDYDIEKEVPEELIDAGSDKSSGSYTELYKRIKHAGSGRYIDPDIRISSLKVRFLAMGVDIVIIGLSSLLVTGSGFYILGLRLNEDLSSLNNVIVTTYLIINVLLSTYFFIFPALFGRTLGKIAFKIRIISERGDKPKASDFFVRWVGYFLSALPLFVGFLWAFGNPLNQCWHDKLAKTIVIKEREFNGYNKGTQ